MGQTLRESSMQATSMLTSLPGRRQPKVIVSMDRPAPASMAWPVAWTVAALEGASLHVLVVGQPEMSPRGLAEFLAVPGERLRGLVLHQTSGPSGVHMQDLVRALQATVAIVDIGAGGDSAGTSPGPELRDLLQSAPCPVIVVPQVREPGAWALRTMLVPHDGEVNTSQHLGFSADLAYRSGAEVIVLHVATMKREHLAQEGSLPCPRYVDQPQHEWPAWREEFLSRFLTIEKTLGPTAAKVFIRSGEPGPEIASFAAEHKADLIALGWQGRWDENRAATMRAVLSSAPCPVLAMHITPDT